MRTIFTFLALGLVAGPVKAGMIGDAIRWYSLWAQEEFRLPGAQTCRGEHTATGIVFRCDPLQVVMSLTISEDARCQIVNIRAAKNSEDGTVMNKGPRPVVALPPRRSGSPSDSIKAFLCGEVPPTVGKITFRVSAPGDTQPSKLLGQEVAEAVGKYFHAQPSVRRCVLYSPRVKAGDPFAHVYEDCQGEIGVHEFVISNENVADFPHWSYKPGGLPLGYKRRLDNEEMWFQVIR